MRKAFVISDIHGMHEYLRVILKFWDKKDKLIILGDMIDRGPDSREVIREVMDLQRIYDVEVLMGNHEDMMIKALKKPVEHYGTWAMNGGNETIRDFLGDKAFWTPERQRVVDLQTHYLREVSYLETLKTHYLFGKVLFTHAGFNSAYDDIKFTSRDNFLWMRKHYLLENKTGLVNVFGHTPTMHIRSITDANELTNEVWLSECGTYIGIDGAAAYGGQLNAILIDENGELLKRFKVSKTFL